MIRGRKVAAVASFELWSVVRRPSYLIMTFGLPLFFVLISGVPAALQSDIVEREVTRTVRWGVLDRSGVLDFDEPTLELDTVVFVRIEDDDARRRALSSRDVEGVFEIPADYVDEGEVRAWLLPDSRPFDVGEAAAEEALGRLLVARLLRGRVEPAIAERVRRPIELERLELNGGAGRPLESRGVEAIAKMLVPIVLSMLLLMALMTTSGYLVQAIAVEKESKVVEILLSSAEPDEILAGKLLGLGGAGILQFAVWSSMVVLGLLSVAGLLSEMAISIPWAAIAVSPAFFVLGYFFVGSLMLSTGSLGNSAAESQKLTLVWGLLSLLPMMLLSVLMSEPHGPVAVVLSWVPFTAPLTVVMRMALDPDGIATWEVVGALVVMVLATWLALRLGARLFRVGLLLTGSWPGLREILRQARLRA